MDRLRTRATATNTCYWHLAPGTWTDAEDEAQRLGAHLATIRSQAEQDWVWSTFGPAGLGANDLWIGLTDRVTQNVYLWQSGEPLVYTNWGPGEPNNATSGEDYIHMQGGFGGGWQDRRNNQIAVAGVAEIVPLGARRCQATANSVGSAAFVSARGSTMVADQDFTLVAGGASLE